MTSGSMRETIEAYVAAMEAGRDGVDALVALFAPEGVYVEHFTGRPRTYRGTDAIREYFRANAGQALPDLRLVVDELRIDAPHATVRWTCHAPDLPQPAQGTDHYTIGPDGIERLETTIATPPTTESSW